jgi:hypothetical protein
MPLSTFENKTTPASRQAPHLFDGRPDYLGAALTYGAYGLRVAPLRRKAFAFAGAKDRASSDPEDIRQLWTEAGESVDGIAARTGRDEKIIGLDLDISHPGAADGRQTMAKLGWTIPPTPMARTPRGIHAYFASPAFLVPSGPLAASVEVKGNLADGSAGWITLPPGAGRWWLPDAGLSVPFAEMPLWMRGARPSESQRRQPEQPSPWRDIPAYCNAALKRACEEIAAAPNQSQWRTYARECRAMGRLVEHWGMPPRFAKDALLVAGLAMTNYGPAWTAAELTKLRDYYWARGEAEPKPPER